jgi:recombination protein RecT
MSEQNTAITPYENYKKIVDYANSPEVMNIFTQVLGREAPHYVQSAILAVKMNERLMECTPRSIFNAALRAATLRLSCDPSLGHAFLVPYKNKGTAEAQFQPGWKGIQHMALRSGKYGYINVSDIWNGEEVEEDRITGDLLIVGIPKSPKVSIGLIASFKLLAGMKKSIYMSNEELEAHGAKYSKSYSRSDSIWKTNKRVAYHKTILLKLLRNYGYISPLEASILSEDEQSEVSDLNMPNIEDVTIIEKPKLSKSEINRSLGLNDDEEVIDGKFSEELPDFIVRPQPDPMTDFLVETFAVDAPPKVEADIMTIERAMKIENSEGVKYGDIPNDKLQAMVLGINKGLRNGIDDAKRAEYLEKKEAIGVILKARANKEI